MIIPSKDYKKAWIILVVFIVIIGGVLIIDKSLSDDRLKRAEEICKVDVCQVYGNDSSMDYVYASTYLCGCFKNQESWNFKVVNPRNGKITEPEYEPIYDK